MKKEKTHMSLATEWKTYLTTTSSARHRPEQNPLYKPGRRLILFLGRVDKKKGLDILLRAFNEIKDSYPQHDLMIVGPDESDWARKLKKLTSELGICPRVHWMGMRVGREKILAYTQAEFFVLPSHQENFGLAVAEAMALSLPVLITSKVNIWREVTAARAGLATDDNVDGIRAGLEEDVLPVSGRESDHGAEREGLLHSTL